MMNTTEGYKTLTQCQIYTRTPTLSFVSDDFTQSLYINQHLQAQPVLVLKVKADRTSHIVTLTSYLFLALCYKEEEKMDVSDGKN